MLPQATHAREVVLELRQLDPELALGRDGVLGEDVEDQLRAVDDARLRVLEPLLRRRQLAVDDEYLGTGGREGGLQLLELSPCRRTCVDPVSRCCTSSPTVSTPTSSPARGARRAPKLPGTGADTRPRTRAPGSAPGSGSGWWFVTRTLWRSDNPASVRAWRSPRSRRADDLPVRAARAGEARGSGTRRRDHRFRPGRPARADRSPHPAGTDRRRGGNDGLPEGRGPARAAGGDRGLGRAPLRRRARP